MAIAQALHRDKLLHDNAAVIARIRDRLHNVGADTIARRPPSGGWSVAEVLEHLIVSAESYLEALRPLVRQGDRTGADPNTIWKPTLMGGMLAWSLRNPRKLPAPRIYKPGPTPRPDAPDVFLRLQEEAGRLMTEAQAIHWRRARLRSPVTPILGMNLGDAFTVLVVHAERHAAQIERVLKEVAE